MIEASEGNIDLFVSISFAVRIMQALGNTAVGTAIFALATMLFPDNPASIMVILKFSLKLKFNTSFSAGNYLTIFDAKTVVFFFWMKSTQDIVMTWKGAQYAIFHRVSPSHWKWE